MANEWVDGEWSTAQVDGEYPRLSFPLQAVGDTSTKMVKQAFIQKAANYRGFSIGSSYPFRNLLSFAKELMLVEHTPPTIAGGEYVRFEATWVTLPRTRYDAEDYPYTYQFTRTVDSELQLGEVTQIVNSSVKVTYLKTDNPITIEVRRPLKYVRFPGSILATGGNGRSQNWTLSNGFILAEATSIERWMGNIFEIRERFVPPQTLGEALA